LAFCFCYPYPPHPQADRGWQAAGAPGSTFWPTLGWITYGISSIILLFAGDPPSPKKEAGVSKWKGIFR